MVDRVVLEMMDVDGLVLERQVGRAASAGLDARADQGTAKLTAESKMRAENGEMSSLANQARLTSCTGCLIYGTLSDMGLAVSRPEALHGHARSARENVGHEVEGLKERQDGRRRPEQAGREGSR